MSESQPETLFVQRLGHSLNRTDNKLDQVINQLKIFQHKIEDLEKQLCSKVDISCINIGDQKMDKSTKELKITLNCEVSESYPNKITLYKEECPVCKNNCTNKNPIILLLDCQHKVCLDCSKKISDICPLDRKKVKNKLELAPHNSGEILREDKGEVLKIIKLLNTTNNSYQYDIKYNKLIYPKITTLMEDYEDMENHNNYDY